MKRIALVLLLLSSLFHSPLPAQNQKGSSTAEERPAAKTDYQLPQELADELKKAEEQGDSRFFQEFMNMLFTLGVIIAFVMLFMWILKRMLSVRIEQVNKTSTIKVLERRTLTPKTSIYVLGIFGKAVAIADSTNGVTVLTELSRKDLKEEPGMPEATVAEEER
jgi:flagellar protein FliO/FliZ